MNSENVIRVWEFHDAPKEYRQLSQNGGDEDYIMYVPASWNASWPDPMLLEGTMFGWCCVESHTLVNGDTILIGCHA